MADKLSLAQLLQRTLLPKLLAALFAICLVLGAMAVYFAQQQVADTQRVQVAQVRDDLQNNLNDTLLLLESIAANDIIINSFIDLQQRDTYLPLFFRTLRLSRAQNMGLALYDFAGTPIIDKNWPGTLPPALVTYWQGSVLEQGRSVSLLGEHGALLAVPVYLGTSVEGALVVHSPSIDHLIYQRTDEATHFVTDEMGTVLYSSAPSVLQPGQAFVAGRFASWVIHSDSWQNVNIHSMAPLTTAYQPVFWLLPVLLSCIGGALVVSLYAMRRSARLAAATLSDLYTSIASGLQFQNLHVAAAPKEEAIELSNIRNAFNQLTTNLMTITLSNRQFSNVIDSLEEVLVVLDNHNRILLSNHQYQALARNCAFSQKTLNQILDKIDNQTDTLDQQYQHTEQGPVTIKWMQLPFVNEQREVIGKILVGNDITARRTLESRNRLMTHAMESATVAIAIGQLHDGMLSIVYVNDFFTKLSGFSFADAKGKPMTLLTGIASGIENLRLIKKRVAEGKPIDQTLCLHHRTGRTFHARVILNPVTDGETVTHYVAFFQDVTEQEKARQYLEEARQKAEDSARMKSSFLASMSHEVRTPLHGIDGTLKLLDKTALDNSQQHYLSLALQSLRNLQHIVDDILDFSKIEAGQLKIEAIPFNLPLLIDTIVQQYEPLCAQKHIDLQVQTTLQGIEQVQGDPVRLRQILGNLLSNAVKFTENGQVRLSLALKSDKSNWKLTGSVRDSGIGIAEDKLASIFDVFTQEDSTTTRRFGGTGLGLAITRQLCQLCKGDITVQSEKGVGSQFIFTLQLQKCSHALYQLPSSTVTKADAERSRVARVLLVEDNEINQLIARENMPKHKVMTAGNGKQALAALQQIKTPFDIILMDCHMPEMDGFEATRRIRAGEAGERNMHIPIIALTANAMKGDREFCLEAGMTDYIAKPFSAPQLEAVIQDNLAPCASAAAQNE